MLRKLFENNPFEYTAHVGHVFYAVLIMATGTATFLRDGWKVFGVATFILGAALGVVVLLCLWWQKAIRYFEVMDNLVTSMNRANNPDLWIAFWNYIGVNPPAQKIQITETKDNGQGFTSTKLHELPVSPMIMQTIADIVLSGNSFSEPEIVKKRKIMSGPKFRKLQDKLEQQKYIRANNRKHNNLGYSLTRKGHDAFYQYASQSVKMKLDNQESIP